MATKPLFLPTLSLLFLAAAATVSGRPGIPFHPCNTLIISTYSSLHPHTPTSEFFIIDLRPLTLPHHHHHLHRHNHLPLHRRAELIPTFTADKTEITDLPLGFSTLKERTKDILSVVASLLFGAACGALTATTIYLVWSLCNYCRRSIHGFNSDDDDDDNDDIFNPKKSHYVAIPSSETVKEKHADSTNAAVAAKETV
ncbi:hypothetical protein RND81_04G179800 [Saponaria officinalis]|uniref:Uncharacterized protein n=1 Tax=Saponaria officinalis TaxID=3572 RepID=A0AAW1LF13_SAPOF